ncbi:hypothetical protein Pd630_LPD12019 (plasmid) [Rhodococcus opacus PD630]|nr:hypothetical protein Pd630_LPD12019 [Rhodococcus opacus PD630]
MVVVSTNSCVSELWPCEPGSGDQCDCHCVMWTSLRSNNHWWIVDN